MRLKVQLGTNPIVVKELRSRMRGWRASAILTGMLLLLGGASYAIYLIVLSTSRYTTVPLSPQIGQTLFAGLAFLELMLVCFVTPAVTAGSISNEQERLTYEMLLATPLPPGAILRGKLFSALSYVFLLIFAAVPMSSLVFVFGGVVLRDMLKVLAILVAMAVMLGVIGTFLSALLGRTVRATVISYLVVLILLVGPFVIYVLVGVIQNREPPRWLLIPNPIGALFSALTPSSPSAGPFGFVRELGWFLSGRVGAMSGVAVQVGVPRPLYHYTLPLYAVTTLLVYLLTTRLVRPVRRWRVSWREAGAGLAMLALLGGVVVLAFVATAGRYEQAKAQTLSDPFSVPVMARPVPVREVPQVVVEAKPIPTPTPSSTPAATPPATLSEALSEEERVALYVALVQELCTVDLAASDPQTGLSVIYLVPPDGLTEGEQAAVMSALPELPVELAWADEAHKGPREGGSGYALETEAVVTMGDAEVQADGRVLVDSQLESAATGVVRKAYLLELVEGVWEIQNSKGTDG